LYGGSVNLSNIKTLMQKDDIDGVLIGRASLDATTFLEMVNYQRFGH
ncbi:MAG: triose-phosphate isomerase, partial [Limosilactobacillus fermentum]|nr:triose-phosphate isomerase [Limosilactobacillus fermentum]